MKDKKNKSGEGRNRRNVLEAFGTTVGATSLYSGLSTTGLAAESDTTPDSNIQVVDTSLESGTSVSTMSNESSLQPEIQKLIDFIEQDSSLTGVTDIDLAINVETNDEEFNTYDPAINIIPFGSDKRNAEREGRGPQQGSGLLFVYTIVENDERVPIGTFGMTSRPVGGRGMDSASEVDKRQIRSYVLDDGKPVRAETQVKGELQATNDGVSTQISVVCASCQTLVDAVCIGGTRVLGQYACVGACSAAFGANFIAIFGCASICSTMFTAISAVGCTAGASVICEEMTDLSPWYVTFC